MSLYDDIDIAESVAKDKKAELAGWGSSIKMLQVQQQLQAKNKANLRDNQGKKRGGASLAPVINLKRSSEEFPLSFNHQTGKLERMERIERMERMERVGGNNNTGSIFLGNEPAGGGLLAGVVDEYNPFQPNDYEDYMKKRREQKKREKREEKAREEEERRNRSRYDDEDIYESRRRPDSDEEEEREKEKEKAKRGSGAGAAIAPPSMLLEEAPVRENSGSNSPTENDIDGTEMSDNSPPRPNFGPMRVGDINAGNSVASKIMAKYGYREGQGLGRKEQGMSTALQVEKTSKRGGKIIHERDVPKAMESAFASPRQPTTNTEIMKNPSKVVALRNMVGPGEVDEDLEPETAEECTKYGKVIKCVIFEFPDVEPEEAVRIFVEFERLESAIKAIVDLNGRYFGGRQVRACFYNLDKFRRLDLTEDLPI